MFSCCRCVNPKSPKYKKKGNKDNEDDDSSVGPPEEGGGNAIKEESSEEEIKVEIIETDVRGENAVESSEAEDSTTTKQSASPPTAPPDGGTTGSATSTSTASPAKLPTTTTDEANQSQSISSEQQPVVACCSPKDSPGKSTAAADAEPKSEEVETSLDEVVPPPVENVIPTTVAEVVEANDTAGEVAPAQVSDDSPITANVEEGEKDKVDHEEEESKSCELKNEENNVIIEHEAEDATNGTAAAAPGPVQQDDDKEPEPEQEQKAARECDGNDESQSSGSGPPSEIEILPGTATATSAQNEPEIQSDKVEQEDENEDDDMVVGSGQRSERTLRLRSDTSNSQATIEETIDIQNYLPKQGESEEDSSPNGLMDTSDNVNNELCSDDNHVPKTAPDKAVESNSPDLPPEQQSASRNGSVSEVRSNRPSITDSIENGQLPTSRKESANSDDTTIRTQLSFRESCLSRRSSSKSSIKKKVAYCDSTEIIPPPEYSPAVNDEEDEVFSDSIPPKLPRGNMCAPYATKRGSIPGLVALPDWFAEDRLMMLVFLR